MKSIFSLIIGVILTVQIAYSQNLADEFFKYEKLENTVVLTLNKMGRFHKSKETFKIKNEIFFRIVPPKYEITFDTIEIFDESKYQPEMKVLYEIVQEQILIKRGGYKWINEGLKIENCKPSFPFQPLKKNEMILKFVKEPDEYGVISKLVLNVQPNHSQNVDWKKVGEQNRKATEIAKEGKIRMILKKEKIISNGYLKECSLDEVKKEYIQKENLVRFMKGCWKVLKKEKGKINCDSNLINIQIALRSLGYETNIDGKDTTSFKFAKSLFLQEHNLDRKDEKAFLKALGF